MRAASLALTLLCATSLVTPATPVLALDVPASGSRDGRVRTVSYDPNQVVRIVGRYKTSTQIMFAPSEEISDVGLGNSVAWELAPAGNSIFLKPREKQPPTNLQIVTIRANGERRAYQFELEAIEGNAKDAQAYYSVRFNYPADDAALRRAQGEAARGERENQAIDATLSLHQQYGTRNYRYSAQGTRSLQPDAIFDDGKVTTMRFAGNRPIPAVYAVSDGGEETLIPTDVRDAGETVVVHALAREFRLRAGRDVLCLFNEGYDAVGVNPGTGTTSPSIARQVKPNASGVKPARGAVR